MMRLCLQKLLDLANCLYQTKNAYVKGQCEHALGLYAYGFRDWKLPRYLILRLRCDCGSRQDQYSLRSTL